MTRLIAGLALLMVMLAGIVGLAAAHERLPALPLPPADADFMYLRSPSAASRLALSYDALAADAYWIRALQYYGGQRLSPERGRNFDRLYPMLDLATSLDPHFNIAYRFGAIFLGEPFPAGAGRPDQAIALLMKGLASQPQRWEFAYDIGFVHYWWRQDYAQAADWFQRAADIDDAPSWLPPLAAVVLAEGGSRASSRLLWQQILETAEVDWLRRTAERRLQQLDAMDAIEQLSRIAAAYEQRAGVPLRGWDQLVRSGMLRGVPADPEGYPFVIEPRGAVGLHPDSPLNPLPVSPTPFRAAGAN
ncbi:MAG: hypothetical protein AB7K63_09100 [Vicinamibacterales bacterium]